jgi:hypothetical protein
MPEILSFLTPLKWLLKKAIWLQKFMAYYPQRTETQVSKILHLPFWVEIRQLRIIYMGIAS